MKAQLQQLATLLTKNIASLYLITGDEPLLLQEAKELIYQQAQIHYQQGGLNRERFYAEARFNWRQFLSTLNNSSLFSEHELIELHLQTKLTDEGSKILQNYAKNPVPDKTLVIVSSKLDAVQQKNGWFKAVETYGIVIQVWPIEPLKMPAWIMGRLNQVGLKAEPAAILLLAEYVAGNLLAAIQEIEKLKLLYGSGKLSKEEISAAITDNAHFNIFNLITAAMNKKTLTVNRALDKLRDEACEPTLVLWSIIYKLRPLINLAFAVETNANLEQAMIKNKIWQKEQPLIKKLLSEYSLTQLETLFKTVAEIDLIIKGADNERLTWHELKKAYLKFTDSTFSSIAN